MLASINTSASETPFPSSVAVIPAALDPDPLLSITVNVTVQKSEFPNSSHTYTSTEITPAVLNSIDDDLSAAS